MRRIVIFHTDGGWAFERPGDDMMITDSPLKAAIAAMQYGETLRGHAMGYIIRLDHGRATSPEDMIVL
ncbi:MAG TPA: hypothetical protein VFS24_04360, partial [Steroidobacteraceae bacterium]|nr:hypothetical protein [Steroidobacteraceae bacterium]